MKAAIVLPYLSNHALPSDSFQDPVKLTKNFTYWFSITAVIFRTLYTTPAITELLRPVHAASAMPYSP